MARPLLVRQRPRETRGVRGESAGGLRLPGRRPELAPGRDGARLDRRGESRRSIRTRQSGAAIRGARAHPALRARAPRPGKGARSPQAVLGAG